MVDPQLMEKLLEKEQLPKETHKWASVSVLEVLSKGKRLEGSYFDIEGKRARQAILECGYPIEQLLGKDGFLERAFHRPRFKRIFIENGLPIYSSFQCLDFDPKPLKFVSEKTKTDFDKLIVKSGQLLVTCSGTVGHVTYVGKTLAGKLFSHDLIRLQCHDDIDAGYLHAFLCSRPGHLAVKTNYYGSVVTHIEPEHLGNVPVADPPERMKKQIAMKVLTAFQLRDEANELLHEADRNLLDGLGLKELHELKPKYLGSVSHKVFSVRNSHLNMRLDGSYHIPLADELIKILKKAAVELTTCGDKRISERIFLPGRFKRHYVEEGYGLPFLSGKNVFQINPAGVKYLSFVKHEELLKKLRLIENVILVTCSGTVGRVQIAPKYFENYTANQHILRLFPSKDINPGFVYCFLASDYGKVLITRNVYGSVVDEIDDNHLASVPFPIPHDKNLIDKIGDLVIKANKKRDKAWQLEKEAIEIVESFINF